MECLATHDRVVLRDAGRTAVFLPGSMDLFSLDMDSEPPLNEVAAWVDTQLPPPKTNDRDSATEVSPSDPWELTTRRQTLLPLLVEQSTLKACGAKSRINRLTLNISNACNLWCSYCYADHGQYHAPASLMPAQRAGAIVQKVVGLYDEVERVQFFGGEPLLNLAAIDATADAFEAAHRNSGWGMRVPVYTATTNGTISSDPVLEVLKRRKMALTVSWDGPREVQDSERPMLGEQSSYDRVVESLRRFEEAGIGTDIECTFNRHHLKSGISVVQLMDFFHEMTGQRTSHISPVFLPSPTLLSLSPPKGQAVFRDDELRARQLDHLNVEALIPLYREACRVTVKNLFAGEGPLLSFAHSITQQIISRSRSETYCPAFFDQLSVATDGTAFPCFMFIGDPSFRLGNILTDEFPTQDGTALFRRYFKEFGLEPLGTRQWYTPLFSGCVAGEYIATSSLAVRAVAPLYEAMIQECLLGVAHYGLRGKIAPNAGKSRRC